jgi:N-methylhydantoinase B
VNASLYRDAVTTELVRQTLVSVTEEMKIKLVRAAYNPIIFEALDFTVGLFDARGRTLSIGLGLPMFVRGMSTTIQETLKVYPVSAMRKGDIYITNDAYITGSHLNHIILSMPVFVDGEVVAFTSSMAHWMDIGGVATGITTSIYEEGLQIPIMRLYAADEPNDDLMRIIEMNVRDAELAMGDLRAQIGAVRAGAQRFLESMHFHGPARVLAATDEIRRISALGAADAIAQIPDGVYAATSFMDGDGVSDTPIPIEVVVRVDGRRMEVDLSGVGDQVEGFYNSGRTAGVSAAQVAFTMLVAPTSRPINDGTFEPLTVILPKHKIVNAVKPAAMRWWMTVPMTVVDTIIKALSAAVPDLVAAGHHADLGVVTATGQTGQGEDRRAFYQMGGLVGGGWGAKCDSDGISATICVNDGDTHNTPVESMELKQPVIIERYALRDDSGGAGRWRGGLGVIQECRILPASRLDAQIERTQLAPWGLFDGGAGLANQLTIRRGAGEEEPLGTGNGKIFDLALEPGDAYVLRTGGGGGYGHPHERPADTVAHDVRQGYVSRELARHLYGVSLVGDTYVVDEDETSRLRAELTNTTDSKD